MDTRCLRIGKNVKCFKDDPSAFAFKDSRDFFVKSVEKMTKDAPFHIVKNCKVQGMECFDRNARSATIFFVMLMIAGVVLNFLHELVHYAFFVMAGYTDFTFTFAASIGFTAGTGPTFGDPSLPWYWWYFATMGPLVMINLTFVIVSMNVVKHDVKNPPFMDNHVASGFNVLRVTFLKALAYTSAFTILTNTLLSPFYNMVYTMIGLPAKRSDFSVAWESSLYIPEPFGSIMRFVVIMTVAVLVTTTIMYIFLYNRRETGE